MLNAAWHDAHPMPATVAAELRRRAAAKRVVKKR